MYDRKLKREPSFPESVSGESVDHRSHEKGTFSRFCRDTSLHGLQYLGQRDRHICEKAFWFIAFASTASIAAWLIWEMLESYINTPLITVFDPVEKRLDQIPFPAVTICNINNVQESKWKELEREAKNGLLYKTLPDQLLLKRLASLYDISQICLKDKTFTSQFRNTTNKTDVISLALEERRKEFSHLLNPVETLDNVSQSCEDMIIYCLWLGVPYKCSDIFEEVSTDFGVCCSFNMMPTQMLQRHVHDDKLRIHPDELWKWKISDAQNDKLILEEGQRFKDRRPRRQKYSGRTAGLSFLVDPELHDYHCSNTDSEGFVLGLHVPIDFPRIKDNGIAIRTNSEVFIATRPDITLTSPSAKQFKIEKRNCYLDGEMELAYYTRYTSSNCLDECIANKTASNCSCLRYYMPNDGSIDTCSPDKYKCTEDIIETLIQKGLQEECTICLPTCSEIIYRAETTTLHAQEKVILDLLEESYPTYEKVRNATIVHVFFDTPSVFPRLRKEMSTIINLISNAGGLLGLCMGFSMLSLLEIVYHFTLRLYCTKYYNRKQSLSSELNDNMVQSRNGSIWKSQQSSAVSNWNAVRNASFLSKMLGQKRESMPVEDLRESGGLSPYFQTTFHADFTRAYYSTAAAKTAQKS